MRPLRTVCYFLLASVLWTACQRKSIIPEEWNPVEKPSIIPSRIDSLPCVYITLPQDIMSKEEWTEPADIRIDVRMNGKDTTVYQSDSLKIKGRGNTTWSVYPKKPYALKLKHKANLIGTGKTSRWVLLANWMDRTLLRNQVAFEAARRTSLEWTPSGVFVKLYLNDPNDPSVGFLYQGIYWLGEKIRVEGSHFDADYLYSFDTSDRGNEDFSAWCHYMKTGEWFEGEVPVTVKYPDKDDFPEYYWISSLKDQCMNALQDVEDAIYHSATGAWTKKIDLNSFCDWYLVNELVYNTEVRHPKSCYFYIRDGVMYAGPVWDFDYGTFHVPSELPQLRLKSALYYFHLFPQPEFRKRLKARWKTLRPQFVSLSQYIDQQADWIRNSEKDNHEMWPCLPNPQGTAETNWMVNMDEDLTFQEAVDKMKQALQLRIETLDEQISQLE